MTNEEAKQELVNLCYKCEYCYGTECMGDVSCFEAKQTAIKALEREPMFIAKSDGTIEQIKNCDDCLYKREWEKIGKLIKVVLEKQTEPQESEGAE